MKLAFGVRVRSGLNASSILSMPRKRVLDKAELLRRRAPWRTADDVELATLEWVDW